MSNIQLESAENEAGLQNLREEYDNNALIAWAKRDGKHPQYDVSENWVPMGKGVKGRPNRDDIVVLQDRYRDELQCKKCSGRGHSQIECRTCAGQGWYSSKGNKVDCKDCICSDFDSPAFPRSSGFYPCAVCSGTGQAVAGKTGIVTSTENAQQPSTGIVVGVGRLVKEWNLGQRVLFSKFAGVAYEAEGRIWRVMKETYPIMEIVGEGDVQTREGI